MTPPLVYKNALPSYCKASVCGRKPARDGWCATHHPAAVKAREDKEKSRYQAESTSFAWRYQREALFHTVANAAIAWAAPMPGADGRLTRLREAVDAYNAHLRTKPTKATKP